MPKPHSTMGAQHARVRRMGGQSRGIRITVTGSGVPPMASIYVAGLTLGNLTDAQKDAFRDEFAIKLGVTASMLELTFSAGSLIIGITINPSRIITPADNAFVVNAQTLLTQLTNSDITDIIAGSGTGSVITGTPAIDFSRTNATITPVLQNNSLSNYTRQTIVNPIVGDDLNECMYTLVNYIGDSSKIVRINKNGKVDIICEFPEDTNRFIFITQDSTCLVMPTSNFSDEDINLGGQTGLPYDGRHANTVYIINISTGTLYANLTSIAFSSGLGFGFNQFKNSVYYGSAESATYGTSQTSAIIFENTVIPSLATDIPLSINNSIVFSDANTGYSLSNNGVVKLDLANNIFTKMAGGSAALNQLPIGLWDNVPNTFYGSNFWENSAGGVYGPFADNQIGTDAWFSSIISSNLILDRSNNRLLVADVFSHRIRAIDLSNTNAVTTLAGTSPVAYGRAINGNGSTYTQQKLDSLGQVGAWDNPISGMPAFNKVNSTYALSTFNQPTSIALFNNTILVLDRTGTRILSNNYVNDLILLDIKTDLISVSSLGDVPTVIFTISNGSYISLTQTELDALKTQFLILYPFIDPLGVTFTLTGTKIIVKIEYIGSTYVNSLSKDQLATVSNLASVFSDLPTIVTDFKNAVASSNLTSKFDFSPRYGDPVLFGMGEYFAKDITIDSSGNVYASDANGTQIKKITPAGVVTVFASGFQAFGLAIDSANNIYASDNNNSQIKKITPAGVVTVFASGIRAVGLAVDSSGNVYTSDYTNSQIKKITPAGVVTVFVSGFRPYALTVDSADNVYASDTIDSQIKKITPAGVVTVFASGVSSFALTIDSADNVYVSYYDTQKVKKITPAGVVTEIASRVNGLGIAIDSYGNLYTTNNIPRIKKFTPSRPVINDLDISVNVIQPVIDKCDEILAKAHPTAMIFGPNDKIYTTDFKSSVLILDPKNGTTQVLTTIPPITESSITIASGFQSYGLVIDSVGNVYAGDFINHEIKKITPSGVVTVFVSVFSPNNLTIDSAGNLYVRNNVELNIKKITPAGVVTSIGSGIEVGGLVIDSFGNIYVSDYLSHTIKKITPAGVVTLFANEDIRYSMTIDSADNIYGSDFFTRKIKKITPSGVVTVVVSEINAGNVAIDSFDNLYAVDIISNEIKKITPAGVITVIGSGTDIGALAIDSLGNLYVSDVDKLQIRKITPISTYLYRNLKFVGIRNDGKYLTLVENYVIDSSQQGNYLTDYIYRIDTSNGNCVKVRIRNTPDDFWQHIFYNKFTDTVYFSRDSTRIQPIPYKFEGLSRFVTGTSTERFPTTAHMSYMAKYLDENNVCYYYNTAIKKWNLITGLDSNIIGVEQTAFRGFELYNYTSPIKFSNPDISLNCYDPITDTLFIADGPAKCIVSVKNVLNGDAFISNVIGRPNADLDANGRVRTIQMNYVNIPEQTSRRISNISGTNKGLVSNVVWTQLNAVHVSPSSSYIFVSTLDWEILRVGRPYNTEDYSRAFSLSKIQGNLVVPFSPYLTTSVGGLTVSASYTLSTVSIYVAGLTLGTLTQIQKDAFTTELAGLLGVSTGLLTLTFTPGSLIILISINSSKIVTVADNAFIINAAAILSQLTNSHITDIITNSGCDTSIAGTANIDHSRTEINIDINLRNDCISKYKNTTIYSRIVGDDVNKCMYTLLNSKIVRINKNGTTNNICNFPESEIREIFITSDKTHLVIPTSIFSRDNVNGAGQTNLRYNASHANKIYVINISTGTIYVNTTQIEFLYGVGFNQFNNSVYYPSAETATYAQLIKSTIVFSNSIINSIISGLPTSVSSNIQFLNATIGYSTGGFSVKKIDLTNNSVITIAGTDSFGDGIWNNVPITTVGSDSWGNASGRVYGPFADNQIGTDAWFSLAAPNSLIIDGNRLLIADRYSHRIRAIDLSNSNAVTTLAGTSPVYYDRAINGPSSNFSPQYLSTLGQVGVWDNPISGMPAFNKVNSSYLTSTFNLPSSITLFDNKLLVLDGTGTRLLSNGRVSDFTVIA